MNVKRIAAVILVALVLCVIPVRSEEAGTLTVYSDLEHLSRHGNVYLLKDGILQPSDLEDAGIEYGDTVRVAFLDQTLQMPVTRDFSEIPLGAAMVRLKEDAVELGINRDSFAGRYIADQTNNADGTFSWTYKEGIEGPVAFRISLVAKGGDGAEGDPAQLTYTDERSDYPNLTDAEFANFRMVATTGMGEGVLYRTASPVNPERNRNAYADAALAKAGVVTVMNLSDINGAVERFEGYGDSYYATTNRIVLEMGMAFDNDDFKAKLARGLRFFAENEGPYAVHCLEGKDRTGTVIALLEFFMGATREEVISDYMLSYYNYYGIRPGDAMYDEIAENNLNAAMRALLGVDDLGGADLAEATAGFFSQIGLTDAELERLRAHLGERRAELGK